MALEDSDLRDVALRAIDEACDCFESLLKSNDCGTIEEFLKRNTLDVTPQLLEELLLLEATYQGLPECDQQPRAVATRFSIDMASATRIANRLRQTLATEQEHRHRFRNCLQNSGLFSAAILTSLDAAYGSLPAVQRHRDSFSRWLVNRGKLTLWQANTLESGFSRLCFGNYRLKGILGQGGMGTVFLAEHAELERLVAIKFVTSELAADMKKVRRFRSEILASGRLKHPAIVETHDAGQIGNLRFLVMEYVPGVMLKSIAESVGHNIPERWLCDCIRQVAEGLKAIHHHRMIHRDISPANILIIQTGSQQAPAAKILDLGLATIRSVVVQESTVSSSLNFYGTPHFVSPEQVQNSGFIDHRSDLYSLGCVLYWVLTAHYPFQGDSAVEILSARLTQDPPAVRRDRPDISPALAAIVDRLLQRDPKDRFCDAEELLAAIRPLCTSAGGNPGDLISTESEFLLLQQRQAELNPDVSGILQQIAAAADSPQAETGTAMATPPAVRQRETFPGRTFVARLAPYLIAVMALLMAFWTVVFPLTQVMAERGFLEIDWQNPDRRSATIEIDDLPVNVPESGKLLFPLRIGSHRLRIEREGYDPVEWVGDIHSRATQRFRPIWNRDRNLIRQDEWSELSSEIAAEIGRRQTAADTAAESPLIPKIQRFRSLWSGSPEATLALQALLSISAISPAAIPFSREQAAGLQEQWAEYLGLPVRFESHTGITFILVPPGNWPLTSDSQGDDSLLPDQAAGSAAGDRKIQQGNQTKVAVLSTPFYLQRREVTQQQYEKVTGTNPSYFSPRGVGARHVKDILCDTMPVEEISFWDAVDFCLVLSAKELGPLSSCQMRLPTELEWEFACRAGTATNWNFGDTVSEQNILLWCDPYANHMPHRAGTRMANAFGFHDMHGNVAEWCFAGSRPRDLKKILANSNPHDQIEPLAVLRGGDWKSPATDCTSASRLIERPEQGHSRLGFRIACDILTAEQIVRSIEVATAR